MYYLFFCDHKVKHIRNPCVCELVKPPSPDGGCDRRLAAKIRPIYTGDTFVVSPAYLTPIEDRLPFADHTNT